MNYASFHALYSCVYTHISHTTCIPRLGDMRCTISLICEAKCSYIGIFWHLSLIHTNGANNANIASEVDFSAYLYPWYTLGPVEYEQDLVSECPVKFVSPPECQSPSEWSIKSGLLQILNRWSLFDMSVKKTHALILNSHCGVNMVDSGALPANSACWHSGVVATWDPTIAYRLRTLVESSSHDRLRTLVENSSHDLKSTAFCTHVDR